MTDKFSCIALKNIKLFDWHRDFYQKILEIRWATNFQLSPRKAFERHSFPLSHSFFFRLCVGPLDDFFWWRCYFCFKTQISFFFKKLSLRIINECHTLLGKPLTSYLFRNFSCLDVVVVVHIVITFDKILQHIFYCFNYVNTTCNPVHFLIYTTSLFYIAYRELFE